MVDNYDTTTKLDGQLIDRGYISLQSESHPIDFRKVELLNLAGCMDKAATNYKSYFVKHVPEDCKFADGAKAAMRKPGEYPLMPDSLPQEGVPKGTLEGPFEFHSQIIPGTVRRYWIFVPAQYDRKKPSPPTCWCSRTASAPPTRTARCACRRSWRTSSPRARCP